jgi:hypothetical protein
MSTYLLRAFLIRTTVFLLLFTTRNARDQNTRMLESKHHPFMSQYKHVVVSVYWSERVHGVTLLALQDRHAAGPSFSIARVYEMSRRLGGTNHCTFTGRGTLISYYKLQMRHTGCFNILWQIANVKSEGARITRSSYTKSTNWSLTINIRCGDSGFLECDLIFEEAEITVKTS